MNILGLNAYHGDSAACLVVDGRLVAAAEEERFRRIKHWAGFPTEAIKYCLEAGGINISQVDHIAINRDPRAHLAEKGVYTFLNKPSPKAVFLRLNNAAKIGSIRNDFLSSLNLKENQLKARFHHIEHHCAHLASAFFVSPMEEADILSVDGFGDFVSTMWGTGKKNKIKVSGYIGFPHSLGHFYLSMTQFLGFKNYGDEYKVMGLTAYGKPGFVDPMRKVLQIDPGGFRYRLNLRYFIHHIQGTSMTWLNASPSIQEGYSKELSRLLGCERASDAPLEQIHKDLAASVQTVYEEAFFGLLNKMQEASGATQLCLAGGCGMNSLANGKIMERTRYRKVYIQAAPGDAGGAIGAAFYVWNQKLNQPRTFVMDHAYWGPGFSGENIKICLDKVRGELDAQKCRVTKIDDEQKLCDHTAKAISEGKVIGWFQGRMEWGPRALGNRSILGDPRRADMKDILNLKIKRRESFRPFAPSILREKTAGWFESDHEVPFMGQVFKIKPGQRAKIPAVTHVDGTGRLQTVTAGQNPRYHRLISAFEKITGVPMVLNTSFNENEPIVCRPEEAMECFLRTKMDILVLENYLIERTG